MQQAWRVHIGKEEKLVAPMMPPMAGRQGDTRGSITFTGRGTLYGIQARLRAGPSEHDQGLTLCHHFVMPNTPLVDDCSYLVCPLHHAYVKAYPLLWMVSLNQI
jgi:hypothetical protein